ncbi:innexin [Paragonimus westermani]|uniref:Innexin n=1 Tax=Paragonimus westermani TaxID=34504 RepID=A0A5J4NSW3_9TREM|nr:innexin [Paragonimus westermani]
MQPLFLSIHLLFIQSSLLPMGPPFVLGLQCIFFYIPHIAWQAVCAHRSGGDLFALVKSAADAATSERGTREKQVKRVAEFLEDMIDGQRDCHKHTVRRRLTRRAYDMCGICVVSKRLGTCLVFSYLGVKILTIVNAIMQVYLIQRFLGFTSDGSAGQKSMDLGKTFDPKAVSTVSTESENFNGFGFGLTVANHIRSGRDWPETMLFPRVAYCRVPGIRLVGVENTYTAQCALPINMLNEKIYIFFWFWIVFLIVASCISLILWLVRMVIAPKRKDFIKRFLRIKGVLSRATHQQISRSDLDDFIDEYLRRDGVFLVRMLALNAGEVITAEIVTVLYKDYLAHVDQHENGSTSVEDEKAALADGKGNPPSYV